MVSAMYDPAGVDQRSREGFLCIALTPLGSLKSPQGLHRSPISYPEIEKKNNNSIGVAPVVDAI